MPTWLLWLLLAVSLLEAAVGAVSAYGARRWVGNATVLRDKLEATRIDVADGPHAAARVNFRELEGLPAPVQRYFRAALTEGQPIVAAATLELAGTFNLSPIPHLDSCASLRQS